MVQVIRWAMGVSGPLAARGACSRAPRPGQAGRQLARITAEGRSAARQLQALMGSTFGIRPPALYLALLLHDQEGTRSFLQSASPGRAGGPAGEAPPDAHRQAAARLRGAGAAQRGAFQDGTGLLGVPVYADGGTVIAFAAASSAIRAAGLLRGMVPGVCPP